VEKHLDDLLKIKMPSERTHLAIFKNWIWKKDYENISQNVENLSN
jgi:hypothetical protein